MRKNPTKSLHLNRETLCRLAAENDLRAVRGGESLFCVPPTNDTIETCFCEWNED